eukprot:2231172-Alexandrium_andersonii.AAC.1
MCIRDSSRSLPDATVSAQTAATPTMSVSSSTTTERGPGDGRAKERQFCMSASATGYWWPPSMCS